MKLKSILLLSAFAFASAANAVVVTQWNFNSPTPDGATTTGTASPSIGSGTASLLGTTATFASGVGSSDPATADDSAWNTTSYPTISAANETEGAQFAVNLAGYSNVSISFDLRTSNSSSKYARVLYTTNGTTWNNGGLLTSTGGDAWNSGSFNLGVAGTSSFAFRVVSTFNGGTQYTSANSGTAYGSAGTWRFDMVTVSAQAVPEPASMVALGLGAAAMLRRRRKA